MFLSCQWSFNKHSWCAAFILSCKWQQQRSRLFFLLEDRNKHGCSVVLARRIHDTVFNNSITDLANPLFQHSTFASTHWWLWASNNEIFNLCINAIISRGNSSTDYSTLLTTDQWLWKFIIELFNPFNNGLLVMENDHRSIQPSHQWMSSCRISSSYYSTLYQWFSRLMIDQSYGP